jgi:hypothetical protein
VAIKPIETPKSLKEQAERARRLATELPGDEMCDRLLVYAEELEKRATRMLEGTQGANLCCRPKLLPYQP